MVQQAEHWAERKEEWDKARQSLSGLALNALDQIDAALWLIAGRRFSQAITALHTAVELLLKAELEKLHPLLIANRIDFPRLKYLLKERLPPPQIPPGELPDIDRTIQFHDALARVCDLYPDVRKWEKSLQKVQRARNNVVHHHDGGDANKYVHLICNSALPFLEEFVSRFTGIDLEKLLGRDVYREIRVACRLCEELESAGWTNYWHALKTVRTVMLYRDVEFPEPFDEQGWAVDDSDREFATADSLRRELADTWQGEIIRVDCRICGSYHAYAGVDEFDDEMLTDMDPHSLACACCGLRIERHDTGLAKVHFGAVSAAMIEQSMADDW